MIKFKECIIHIGTPKTGTTSLQHFFFQNQSNLIKKNIFYPETFGIKNHTNLIICVGNLKKSKGKLHLRAGVTDKNQEEYRNKIKHLFKKEIENIQCTKLLISSEPLSWMLKEEHEIFTLKEFLDNFVENYKIIVYLRPQHELAISAFSTLLHFGEKNTRVLAQAEYNPNLDYEKLLSSWEKVFGKENLIPRIFSKKEFPGEDIKKDFLTILGLNFSEFDNAKFRNESINIDAQRFMAGINRYLPMLIEKKFNKKRGDIWELVSHNRKGKGLLPSREKAMKFFHNFSKSNEKVREKWFPDKKELFEVDFTKYPEQDQQFQKIDYSAFKIFAELWSKKQKNILADEEAIRGQMYIIKGQEEKAIFPLKEALKIKPNHLFALQSICHALIKLKRYDESKEYLTEGISFFPNNGFFKRTIEEIEKKGHQKIL